MKTPTKTEIDNVLEAFAFAEKHSELYDERIDNAPFFLAEKLGWDWESDEDFTHWALKATSAEIAVEGRKRFLAWVDFSKVAQIFTDKVRAWNEGDDWERIKRGEIGANDVCDANQLMIDAFQRVFGREPWFPCNADEGLATMAQVYADFDLMENAWEQAKRIWLTL